METIGIIWVYVGIVENKMETTIMGFIDGMMHWDFWVPLRRWSFVGVCLYQASATRARNSRRRQRGM